MKIPHWILVLLFLLVAIAFRPEKGFEAKPVIESIAPKKQKSLIMETQFLA